MTLVDRQKEFTGFLESGFPELDLTGLPRVSASAIGGNATQENLVKPVTTGRKDHGSDGVLQWRLSRLDGPKGLKGWAASIGWDWKTLKTQAAFTLWELENDPQYVTLLKDLRAGKKKIATLTANFCRIYERPSSEEYVRKYRNSKTGEMESLLDRRITAAQNIYVIMERERPIVPASAKASGATAGSGLVVAGGANVAVGGDETVSAIAAALGLVIVIAPWLWGLFLKWRAPAPLPGLPDDDEASIAADHVDSLPEEDGAKEGHDAQSDTAAYDAAAANCKALEAQLAQAYARREIERKRIADRVAALTAAIQKARPDAPA